MRGRGGLLGGAAQRHIDEHVSAFFDAELSSSIMQRRPRRAREAPDAKPQHQQQQQPLPAFDAYVVLDFEATCERDRRIPEPEVIEFPMVVVDARSGNTMAEFQRYVRPLVSPKLSAFCTELTGITQAVVNAAQPFSTVLDSALEFLRSGGYGEAPPLRSYLFVTWGDWDLRTMLPCQLQTAARIGTPLDVPPSFRRWCNIKQLMQRMELPTPHRMKDLPEMLAALGLRMTGRHHSGIDDCRNIVAILQRLLRDGHVIAPTTDHSGLQQWVSSLPNAPLLTSSIVPEAGRSPPPVLNAKCMAGHDMKRQRSTHKSVSKLKHEQQQTQALAPVPERPQVNILTDEDPLPVLLQQHQHDGTLTETRKVSYSKSLTRILRHAADSMGIPISSAGYVCVNDLLRCKPFCSDPAALGHIAQVVQTNDKQRFKLAYDEKHRLYIRANQGHSLEGIDPELRRIISAAEVPLAIHGTYHPAWSKIRACGYLSTMTRQHIHFAKGFTKSDGVISGMRGNVEVFLHLDVAKAIADGVELWESANGVILTPGIRSTKQLPLTYIEKAVDRQTGQTLSIDPAPTHE
ncbi:phosphotransferase [Trypanosoma grayi]|uniref:phosphotransferase n=1 Tax=Trypanosoma grayi TaxID=71804 RepID=UPI0004F4843D|nr:phosphotransferase [Trypanosoma grayi]KEG09998.1 phosphotransferase [Trypanosoma grayi]